MLRHLWLGAFLVAGLPGFAQTAEPDPAHIERLVRYLGSDQFSEREAATKALDALGEAALPALRKATRGDDPEVRRRAARLVESITGRLRAEALATIKRLGGSVADDAGGAGDNAGARAGARIVLVGLDGERVQDTNLSRLRGLTDLKFLYLYRTGVTDAGLAHLKVFPRLQRLALGDTKVTDAGLKHLSGLSELSDLDLSRTAVTDAGLAHLKACKGLRDLYLNHTKVTDAGVEHLRGQTGLRSLSLCDTGVTDGGLAPWPRSRS
jgi:hypothetical protein